MHTLLSLYVLGIVLVAVVAGYLLPALIACVRRAPDRIIILLVNLFLGWTVAGWLAALVLSLRRPPAHTISIVNHVANGQTPPIRNW